MVCFCFLFVADTGEDELVAVDEGGPRRAFLSEVWRQMRGLAIKWENRTIKLMSETCIPEENDIIHFCFGTKNEAVEVKEIVRPYFRLLGRIIFYSICRTTKDSSSDPESNHFIMASHILPRLYRYYFLKNIDPTDPRYPISHLVHNVIGMKWYDGKKPVEESMQDYVKYSKGGDESKSTEHLIAEFRQAAKEDFIDNRSWATEAIKEGITLGGRFRLCSVLFKFHNF